MPLGSFLESRPQAAFAGRLSGLMPGMRRYFGYRSGDIYNQYLARLAQLEAQGQMPRLRYSQFLAPYEFEQEYFGQSPRNRGEYPSRYAPPARWLSY